MASPNLSGDGQQKELGNFCSSPVLTPGLHGQLTFLSVLNTFMSITALLGNSLILISLHKESSLHPPSKRLLRSLRSLEITLGLTAEPVYVTVKTHE